MPDPRATYRIQLRPDFDFDAAAGVVDYLSALGVSHLYASPYLQAAVGSTHGYDVVDPTRVSEALGGEAGHARLLEALGRAGMGHIVDIVPNHMAAAGRQNAWWWDVLRNGPGSRFAPFFDVDWDPPEPKLRDQVLMPVLGDHYGRELEGGKIRVVRDGGELTVRYHEHALPLSPRSLTRVLRPAAERLAREHGDLSRELGFLASVLARLPEPGTTEDDALEARQRDVAVVDARLASLAEDGAVAGALDAELVALNASPDALDALLDHQNYRLAYWRTARQELDYRRFFDINSLAALRTEDPRVFAAVHGRVLSLVRQGGLDGLRVDHPDGLRDPAHYFQRLRAEAPDAWIVAEKVLMPDEALRPWALDGSTGYEVLADITGVFLEPGGEAPLTELWQAVSGDGRSYGEVAYEARTEILSDLLGADLNRLANLFVGLCEDRRRYRDFTRRALRDALAEVAANFPVYRSYVSENGRADGADRSVIERAVADAEARRPDVDGELLAFLRRILLGEETAPAAGGLRVRFQQLTGAVAAKGEEDTAFYRYNRFVALNDVGLDPGRWGLPVAAFHTRAGLRAEAWPRTMTTLSTHDTKRSADVRARLLVLAEMPARWAEAVQRWWGAATAAWPSGLEPDPGLTYLLLQTAVGAWPIGPDRLRPYMEKAAREAKVRTSWTDPDDSFEAALGSFVDAALAGPLSKEIDGFAARIAGPGRVNSLAQTLVQLTSPGIPDVYQGSELWDLSLVDPDNRRPVDFEARRALLQEVRDASPREVLRHLDRGGPKLRVVHEALQARRRGGAALGTGASYEPLEADGTASRHVLGFVRGGRFAAVVPRLPVGLAALGGWRGTTVVLPEGSWVDAFTGERVQGGEAPVRSLLGRFPVALLEREGG